MPTSSLGSDFHGSHFPKFSVGNWAGSCDKGMSRVYVGSASGTRKPGGDFWWVLVAISPCVWAPLDTWRGCARAGAGSTSLGAPAGAISVQEQGVNLVWEPWFGLSAAGSQAAEQERVSHLPHRCCEGHTVHGGF